MQWGKIKITVEALNLLVRLWQLIVDAAIFEQRVESLQRHFRAVLGEPDLVQDADGRKAADVALFLELLALPKG